MYWASLLVAERGRGLNGVIGLAYTVELWWDMGIDEINDRGVVMGENDLQTELSDGELVVTQTLLVQSSLAAGLYPFF